MRKAPSYLKGLAKTRARSAGDAVRLRKLYEEIGKKLDEAEAGQAACDTLIQKYDPRLAPARIPNINGWQGRYGKRGALGAAILRHVEAAWPDEITPIGLCVQLQLEFQLDFSTWQEKHNWAHQSVYSKLWLFAMTGRLESCHNPATRATSEVGRWRWKSDAAPSLDRLRELAAVAGA
ncbi:hypothetical protein [Massilia sp. TWR1-2-2]|uniref:hypothetical protein n=1 Tax=Massilia sp. TWR1-2-2 TaxID=2804584 RepID=UPI003CEB7F59